MRYPLLISALSAVLLLFTACKKDEENLFDLTFTGKVTDQLTGAPIQGVKVYVQYGEACCGGIAKIMGLDSAITGAAGQYSIPVAYKRDTSILYRHMVYVPGWQLQFRPLQGNSALTGWMTYAVNGKYAVPEDIKEVVKEGTTYNTNFILQPAGRVQIQLAAGVTMAPKDTITLQFSAPGNNHPQQGDYLGAGYIALNAPFVYPVNFAAIAGKPNLLQTTILKNGVKSVQEKTINVGQGQTVTHIIDY